MSAAPTRGCSFCGKTQDEVQKLVRRPGARICNQCLELCADIIGEVHDQHEGNPELAAPLTEEARGRGAQEKGRGPAEAAIAAGVLVLREVSGSGPQAGRRADGLHLR